MTDQSRRGSEEPPNSASEMEPAEGSRDIRPDHAQQGAGITNRPVEQEQQEQESLPPRGTSKDGSLA